MPNLTAVLSSVIGPKPLPVITTAATLINRKTPTVKLKEFQQQYGVNPKASKLVIECSQSEFNHYLGMKYPGNNIMLFSAYWYNLKWKNKWFTIHRNQKRPASLPQNNEHCWEEFVNLINYDVSENIRRLGFLKPSLIQSAVFNAFSMPYHLFIAAETGSGKTLAYAAPILTELMKMKEMGRSPKAIIFVPSSLVEPQTYMMVKDLVKNLDGGNDHLKVISGNKIGKNNPNIYEFDILVATPSRAVSILKKCITQLDVSFIVMDEADTLLDDGYISIMTEFFSIVPVKYSSIEGVDLNKDGARMIFCSATCPNELQMLAEGIVHADYLQLVKSDYLHKILPNVKQTFIRLREKDKLERVVDLLSENRSDTGRTLIFCKDSNTVEFLSRYLTRNKISNQILKTKEDLGKQRVFVSTDNASRGLDILNLRHVINFDMPRDLSEYIHRLGRVGRCSFERINSRMTTFFGAKKHSLNAQCQIVHAVERAARLDQPLDNVPTNIRAKIKEQRLNRLLNESSRFLNYEKENT